MSIDTLFSHIPENQRVIEFLYRCRDATDNKYKKASYTRAIDEIHSLWETINHSEWKPSSIGPSITNKIGDFLENADKT